MSDAPAMRTKREFSGLPAYGSATPPVEVIGGSKPPPQAQYVMGHDDRERRRLALQASILNPFTEQLLRRAGIRPGCTCSIWDAASARCR
jgi:hypothetical protein